MKTIKGVFSEEFQLDDAPNFGDWIITATVHGEVRFNLQCLRFDKSDSLTKPLLFPFR